MHLLMALAFTLAADTTRAPQATGPDSVPSAAIAIPSPLELARRQDELPDSYYTRLRVHRVASYAVLPLFALQFAAGTQLFDKSNEAPQWAKVGHRVGATGVAALFATNLVTGIPNLIAKRDDPRDRGRRIFHATTMLVATAGFTATGLIAERAERDPDARRLHRGVAYGSMGIATIGYLSMLDLFRRD